MRINRLIEVKLISYIYFLTIISVSALAGYARNNKYDRYYKLFRFQNKWHYILYGEFFDFPRANFNLNTDQVENIEAMFVDAVSNIGDESYIYNGFLVDYELSKNGGLETITLKSTQRRKISEDSKVLSSGKLDNSKNFYPIDGHIVLLKYSEIINLNFSYYKLEEVDDGFKTILIS